MKRFAAALVAMLGSVVGFGVLGGCLVTLDKIKMLLYCSETADLDVMIPVVHWTMNVYTAHNLTIFLAIIATIVGAASAFTLGYISRPER